MKPIKASHLRLKAYSGNLRGVCDELARNVRSSQHHISTTSTTQHLPSPASFVTCHSIRQIHHPARFARLKFKMTVEDEVIAS